jgi:lipopolysaccharide biosynthesis protein
LGREAVELKARESAVVEQATSQLYCNPHFFLGHPAATAEEIAAATRIMVRGLVAGMPVRKQCPGQLPIAILNQVREGEETEIIATGQAGCVTLVPAIAPNPVQYRSDIAVHCHFYYPATIEPIFRAASRNATAIDWWISIGGEVTESMVRESAAKFGIRSLMAVESVPNRGRDLGPMLVHFREVLRRYSIIGHVHGKFSHHVSERDTVEKWNRFLLENTLGGEVAAFDEIVALFDSEPSLGLVFPDDPLIDRWASDWPKILELADKLKISVDNPRGFEFPVGNMYWARREALAPLLDYPWQWEDLPAEPLAIDGTLLHRLERLTPFIVRASGYQYRTTYTPQLVR